MNDEKNFVRYFFVVVEYESFNDNLFVIVLKRELEMIFFEFLFWSLFKSKDQRQIKFSNFFEESSLPINRPNDEQKGTNASNKCQYLQSEPI